MIIDKLENSDLYAQSSDLKTAFDYLKSLKTFPQEAGKVKILGDKIFANIDQYDTKPESSCRMEAHREYMDIQILFTGKEIISWHPVSELNEDVPYDTERDVAFYASPSQAAGQAVLSQGIFMLLYPEDGHMPQIAIDGIPEPVEKVVMKIRV